MKSAGVVIWSVLLLAACEYSGVELLPEANPSRELQYNYQTGEKMGEKTFTYDANGKLTYEILSGDQVHNFEVFYEYDAAGNLIKRKQRHPSSDKFFILEATYLNGVKAQEVEFLENYSPSKRLFYYTGTRLDSMQYYGFSSFHDRYLYGGTQKYAYDAAGRLIQEGGEQYRYEGNNLVETCNAFNCRENEYNSDGKITRIIQHDNRGDVLVEERFYIGNRLTEKLLHTYPFYSRLDMPFVIQLKYEY